MKRWVQLVKQEERCGCGPASFAMVTGLTYREAVVVFVHRTDFTKRGLTVMALDRRLVRAGFAIERRFKEKGEKWPADPFADLHICLVRPHGNPPGRYHYVVLLPDGTVLDPNKDEPVAKGLRSYKYVLNIAGLHPLPSRTAEPIVVPRKP